MNACLEDVIEHIKPHLLSDIVIKTDKKVLKKGKLMIFQVKQHFLIKINSIFHFTDHPRAIKKQFQRHYQENVILLFHIQSS